MVPNGPPKSLDDLPVSGSAAVVYSLLTALETSARSCTNAADLLTKISPTLCNIELVLHDNRGPGSNLFLKSCGELQSHIATLLRSIEQAKKEFHGINRYLQRKALNERMREFRNDIGLMKQNYLAHITTEGRAPTLASIPDRFSISTTSEPTYQKTNINFESSQPEVDEPVFEALLDKIIFNETRRVFWNYENFFSDIDVLASQDPHFIIDLLQYLIDTELAEDPDHWRRRCMKLILTLTRTHGILPTSFYCPDAQREGKMAVWGGRFADMWKGRMGDTLICIKVLRVFVNNGIEERTRLIKNFCREALAWRNMNHPNVLPFLGVSTELFAPSFCLISPWMQNGNIMSFLARNPAHDRLTSIKEVASGMAYLHLLDPPILHADIRGAKILVNDDYQCCLADFGLALVVETQVPGSPALALGGSTRWLAPEVLNIQLFDPNYITARDVYAFGCTVIEIYTGEPPFSHLRTETAIIHKVLTNVCTGKTKLATGDLGRVGEVVNGCLETRAGDRLCATEVVRMLEELRHK